MAKKINNKEVKAGETANRMMEWYGVEKIWVDPERDHWFTTEALAQRHEKEKGVKLLFFEKKATK